MLPSSLSAPARFLVLQALLPPLHGANFGQDRSSLQMKAVSLLPEVWNLPEQAMLLFLYLEDLNSEDLLVVISHRYLEV